jgi:hypothetical protein
MTMLNLMSYRPIVCLVLAGVFAFGVLLATTRSRARASGPTPLLPDLVADPPDNVSLETSDTEGGLSATEKEPELLLRFNGYVHNIGPGPLDFRGKRQAPKLSGATQAKVRQAEEEVAEGAKEELELPRQTEEELASPPMGAFQRLFASNEGAPTNPEENPEENENYLERLHEDEPSNAEMLYVNADGHHHWHLQHVARYSLWNAEKTAEVAPAQKVGFCLEDSEHVEPGVGPAHPVYADNIAPFRDFCQQFRPDTTEAFEGISPGWRDRYTSDLGFQWVNASNVLPGEYWLREDVDPTDVIKEVAGAKTPAYATSPTIIPGFDAQAQAVSTQSGEARTVTLSAKAWNDSTTPNYAVVSLPQHGRLAWVSNNRITYTPNAGYFGADSFSFSAGDPNSRFPLSPAVATVAIGVAPAATVTINGAPASMVDGRHVQLSSVESDCPVITWKATAGSITPFGRYTAPSESPLAGTAAVSASCGKAAEAKREIKVLGLSRPQAGLSGRRLLMTTRVSEAGRARLSAYLGKRPLGTCVGDSRAERTFACGVTLGNHVSLDARIGVVATLRFERSTLHAVRPAARVAMIKTRKPSKVGVHAHRSSLEGPVRTAPEPLLRDLSGDSDAVVAPAPSVAIDGAPSSMIAGTSVQIFAIVNADSSAVTWTADSGSITSAGLYTAPSVSRPAATVVVAARSSKGAEDRRTITILPVPVARAAPAAPLPALAPSPSTPSAVASSLGASTPPPPELERPQAVLIGHELIMTTRVRAAGRVRLSAGLGRRRVGSCVAETPADRSFTCRLLLGEHVSPDARVAVLAGLSAGTRVLESARPAAAVPQMKMGAPTDLVANGPNAASWEFLCSP